MSVPSFEAAVATIFESTNRIDPAAYHFLKDALTYTMKRHQKSDSPNHHHVTAKQLLEGCRDYALEEFGPLAWTLFEEWGIRTTDDIGEMVFSLIKQRMFGKQEADNLEDFHEIFDLKEALTQPYLLHSS